jgi:hypothetical protein
MTMATIKSYTDISQSRKLAEILSVESADQSYIRVAIAGDNLTIPEEMQYKHNGDMPFVLCNGVGIPCWSLAALLSIIPYNVSFNKAVHRFKMVKFPNHWECYHENFGIVSTEIFKADNPVDVCYEMIIKLKELNLL